ncbi:MAG: hypothetical protein Q9220_006445 [cf. Caloplaca sp. 1 TL-2023]
MDGRKRARDERPNFLPPERAKRQQVTKYRKEYHTLHFPELVYKRILPNEYQHYALDEHEDTIRLLRLHQGSPGDSIQCSFEVVSLAEGAQRQPYEALSYYWGTDEPANEIWIRDLENKVLRGPRTLVNLINTVKPQRFNIRDNLYAALKEFRDTERDIFLWVDALCIDQDNEEEKNQQVSKMARIYSSAYRVLIWLGAGRPICEEAMDFIGDVIQLAKLDTIIQDEQSVEKWSSLVELLRCSWFSRRWVVQELALARDATLHYSTKSVFWTYFADAVALFVDKIDEIRGLFRKPLRFNYNPDYLGDVTALGANILVNVTRNSFRKTSLSTGHLHLEPLSGLEALMSNLLSFEASDPRDTVYALLSIVNDNLGEDFVPQLGSTPFVPRIYPNYTNSAIEVYRDFTRFCVQQSHFVDIICRHWAPVGRRRSATLEPVRLKRRKKAKQNIIASIPSWVPVLTGSPFGDPEDALNGRSNGDSFVGHPDRKCYSASKYRRAEVLFEDVALREPPDPPSPGTESLIIDGIARTPAEKVKINHAFYMYIKGFKVDQIANVSSRIAGGLLLRECLTMGDWSEPDGQSNNDVPDKLWRTLVADRGPNGDNPPNWYQRACLECFAASTTSGDIDTGALIADYRSPSHVVQFLKRVRSVVWNRVFVTSKSGQLFGLAPQGTQVGDYLCILFGCSVPVVLRKCKTIHRDSFDQYKPETYEFIGETYINGLMDGEAFDTRTPGITETFKLK